MAAETTQPEMIQADARLMQRIAAGDGTAWKDLLDQQLARVVLLVKRMLHDQQEAEDVTQESFLRLWQQAPRWQAQARIATWLYRVAYRLAIDRLRQRQQAHEEPLDEQEESSLPLMPTLDSPLAKLEQAEEQRWLQAALHALPTRQRVALLLVHRLDLSVREAASVLQLSETATASLLARGRAKLRLLLSPFYHSSAGN
ncbi:MAG: sigma-70 family RNA polymerase sigma factor [Magnetococcales bacterium]|nr:sigma-70 family RNA polymerase sigma factor [Magnetococcales bacterium]